MSEKDYAPLSTACVRALHDKLYEKRKTAALEVEKMVKEFALANNTSQIKRLLKVLGQDFVLSQNPHARKGGLIGLAAMAIGLGKDTSCYIDELIKPILGCMSDQDPRVRYYASEALYNVVKVSRTAVLPHFAALFNVLSKVATDSDQNVKNASELLDRLLKDIITESTEFNLDAFIPLLRERLYTKITFARQFVVSWIYALYTVPDINLMQYLPELLDGLFCILGDNNVEVQKMCENTLGELLRSIKNQPESVKFQEMINILIQHASSEKSDDIVQYIAITWIKEFVQLSGQSMLPHMSGIFTAILPRLSYESESRRNIKETATAVNYALTKLISFDGVGDQKMLDNELDLKSVVEVLTYYLAHNSIQTKVAVLKWIHDLYIKLPIKMAEFIDVLFPALQRTLGDDSDQVVQQCLVVISEMISKKHKSVESPYYNKFIVSLLNSFNADRKLLNERGSFIIRQLCILLEAEDIYKGIADILKSDENPNFISLMVEHLNMILFTSSELFELRNRLKDIDNVGSSDLFCSLYETWCYNPVATVALCLLAQNYKHACDLVMHFGHIEVTVELLREIDKLVQLIESPIFAYLRLELLEVPCDQHLIRALYGLLMLLPQTTAFELLRKRLNCIPSHHIHYDADRNNTNKAVGCSQYINFNYLLQQFISIQDRHKQYKRSARIKEMITVGDERKATT